MIGEVQRSHHLVLKYPLICKLLIKPGELLEILRSYTSSHIDLNGCFTSKDRDTLTNWT